MKSELLWDCSLYISCSPVIVKHEEIRMKGNEQTQMFINNKQDL